MGRIIALDYGTKRIGVAVTDPSKIIASPLDTIDTKKIIEFLTQYFCKEKVEIIVIGIPKNLDGSVSETEQKVEGFIQTLNQKFNIPIKRMDERFTSKMASHSISLSGISKKKKREKGLIDKLSACIILQDYMSFM